MDGWMMLAGRQAGQSQQQEGKIKIKNIHIQRKLQVMPKSFFIFGKPSNIHSSRTPHCRLPFIRSQSHPLTNQPTKLPSSFSFARSHVPSFFFSWYYSKLDVFPPLEASTELCAFIYYNVKEKSAPFSGPSVPRRKKQRRHLEFTLTRTILVI